MDGIPTVAHGDPGEFTKTERMAIAKVQTAGVIMAVVSKLPEGLTVESVAKTIELYAPEITKAAFALADALIAQARN